MLEKLFKTLTNDTILLTPNRRLAIFLRRQLANFKQRQGNRAWFSTQILPLNIWLAKCWADIVTDKILLTKAQSLLIWEQIIHKSQIGSGLLNNFATAKLAWQAWDLICKWGISLTDNNFELSDDTLVFKNWAARFKEICNDNNWLDSARIIAELDKLNDFCGNKHLILIGFDLIAPSLEKFFARLQCQGWRIEHYDANNQVSERRVLAVVDSEQEIINMALWARKQLATSNNIACIVPDLTAMRDKIAYYFTKIVGDDFDISVGHRFASFPIVSQALQILRDCNNAQKLLPSDWIEHFNHRLAKANWADDYGSTATESLLLERWLTLLEEFAGLDFIFGKISAIDAYSYLNKLVNETTFQAMQHQDQVKPIKILGILEAAGLNFDVMWIMGVTDHAWPAAPKPNPFIPVALQRKLNMPHATYERELKFYQTLTERFNKSAGRIIFSYPQQMQDRNMQVSKLLVADPITLEQLQLPTFELFPSKNFKLQSLADEQGPELAINEVSHTNPVRGGSSIFSYQALCPFKAFATFRLQAQEIDYPQLGLNPKQRGELLHKVLQQIWGEIGIYGECPHNKIKVLLEKTITNYLNNNNLGGFFAILEKQRLLALVSDWLLLEQTRPPFKVVEREKWQDISVNGLRIRTRIDRIDQLMDGSLFIIDYKTGSINSSNWFDEKLTDLQLPLYCIASENIKGVAYACVRKGELQFQGISAVDSKISGIKVVDNWQQLRDLWQKILTKLSEDFITGKAQVAPQNNKVCNYCPLGILCRIKESLA